jgi:hypothetical protein
VGRLIDGLRQAEDATLTGTLRSLEQYQGRVLAALDDLGAGLQGYLRSTVTRAELASEVSATVELLNGWTKPTLPRVEVDKVTFLKLLQASGGQGLIFSGFRVLLRGSPRLVASVELEHVGDMVFKQCSANSIETKHWLQRLDLHPTEARTRDADIAFPTQLAGDSVIRVIDVFGNAKIAVLYNSGDAVGFKAASWHPNPGTVVPRLTGERGCEQSSREPRVVMVRDDAGEGAANP